MFAAFYFAQPYFADFPVFGSVPPTPPAPTPAAKSTASPIYGLGGGTGVLTTPPHYEIDFGRPKRPASLRNRIYAGAHLAIRIGFYARAGSNRDAADEEDIVNLISAALDDDD
jgi:hypothetical protein